MSAKPASIRPLDSARLTPFSSGKTLTLTAGLPASVHFLLCAVASSASVVPFSAPTFSPQMSSSELHRGSAVGFDEERLSGLRVGDEVDRLLALLGVRERGHAEVVLARGEPRDDAVEGLIRDNGLDAHQIRDRLRQVRVHADHRLAVGGDELVGRVGRAAPTPASVFVYVTISDGVFARNGSHGVWADSVGGAGTHVLVERTTFVDNRDTSVEATSGASGSLVEITLDHNAIVGIYRSFEGLGLLPGRVFSELHGNSADSALRAFGTGSQMSASGNTGGGYLNCEGGATLRSYGDNRLQPFSYGDCTHTIVGSQ